MKLIFLIMIMASAVNADLRNPPTSTERQFFYNKNNLSNGGFESGKSGWSSAITITTTSGQVYDGAQGASWDPSGAGTIQSPSWTTKAGVALNGMAECYIKTDDADYDLQVYDGSNVVQEIDVPAAGFFVPVRVYFPAAASTTYRIRLEAQGDESVVYIDNCYFGEAPILNGTITTPWKTFTPSYSTVATYDSTITAVTKASTGITVDRGIWRRVGDAMEVQVTYSATNTTGGAETAGDIIMALPADCNCSIDLNKADRIDSTFFTGGLYNRGTVLGQGIGKNSATLNNAEWVIYPYNANYLASHVRGQNDFWSTTQVGLRNGAGTISVTFTATIPISGWTTGSAVAADQTDYGWTAYTPTYTGFGTVSTSSCYHSRTAENLKVRCRFIPGTTTATEARVSLPNNLVASSAITTLELAGTAVINVTTNGYSSVLREPSVAYLTFGRDGGGSTAYTKFNGNTWVLSGNAVSFEAEVPIQGWASNQRAPALVGSVTSNSSGSEKIERLIQSTACTVTPCTPNFSSGPWHGATYTRSSTGQYSLTVSGWSDRPSCVCTYGENSTSGVCNVQVSSATTILVRLQDSAFGQVDKPFSLICIGPR